MSGGINLYKYGYGNPVSNADSTGLDPNNDVLRCHVCTHNDPVENAAGGLVVAAPLAVFASSAVLTGETATFIGMKVATSPTALRAMEMLGEGVSGTQCKWPSAGSGRQTINGIGYTVHALERMSPKGLIQKGLGVYSRGIPPSVVENAIKHGAIAPGNTPGTIVHNFENITVITDASGKLVITVY